MSKRKFDDDPDPIIPNLQVVTFCADLHPAP
jgi:hypothetical protein